MRDKKIPLDDIQDCIDLMSELQVWIDERKERMKPLTATMILISAGSYICARHAGKDVDITKIIQDSVDLGIDRVEVENQMFSENNKCTENS